MARAYGLVAAGLLGSVGIAVSSLAVSGVEPRRAEPAGSMVQTAEARPLEATLGRVDADTLRKGETLSKLLARSPLDAETARSVLNQIEAMVDARRVRPGLEIRYALAPDGTLRQAQMELDADRVFTVERTADGTEARLEEVEVRAQTAVLAGEVRSSLYRALLDAEGDLPDAERRQLADVLADEVFPWKLDFSRDLRRGDRFRVVYERMARPDGTARSGRVLAAQFELDGEVHDAFLFDVDGRDEYFDSRGQSLRAAFLRAPLEFRRISSAFNRSRFHPILGRFRAHKGTDYAAAAGTPVRAVGDGVVTTAGWGGGYGNVLQLRHLRGYASRYAHLSRFAPGIRPGVRVRQGDVVAYVGSTGLSTGPHLHFEFHSDGQAVNPATIHDVAGEPVPASARARFRASVAQTLALMDRAGAPRLASRPTPAPRSGD
jgi:murein DD-endopeptidase MepM/ murein hydrolase activator NlpD